jgi:predicted dehydrogenase
VSAPSPESPAGAGTSRGTAPRVAVIGASRRRQGLGPFVVRYLRDVGAQVPCFLSTNPATRDATEIELSERWGVSARGYLDFDEMRREEPLDAVAILSPSATHAEYLSRALEAGLHTLCEKPLLWGRDDLFGEASRLVAGFDSAGLVLRENCQWPYTLTAFATLHPGVLDEPFRSFEMRMHPVHVGIGRLGDSLPHALSLLQSLAPGEAHLEELEFSERLGGSDGTLHITFTYRSESANPKVRIALVRSDAVPRRVDFAVNGREAERRVDAEYRLRFAHGERSVPVDDPLSLLIADFVAEVAGRPRHSQRDEILVRIGLVEEITQSYLHWERDHSA